MTLKCQECLFLFSSSFPFKWLMHFTRAHNTQNLDIMCKDESATYLLYLCVYLACDSLNQFLLLKLLLLFQFCGLFLSAKL